MTDTKELTTKEKARLMKNAYQREWARKNQDRIKGYLEKHYAKKYDEMIATFEAESLDSSAGGGSK